MTLQNQTAGFENPPEERVNGTGSLAPETEAAPAQAQPAENSGQPPTVETLQADLAEMKKQVEDHKAQLEKSRNDFNSLNGRYRRAVEEKQTLDEIADSQVSLTGVVQALLRHNATQDEQALAEELEKVQADTQSRTTNRSFTNASADMIREIQDITDELDLDLERSDELLDFRNKWTPAYQASDLAGLYDAYAEFLKTARRLERDKRESDLANAQSAAEEQRRQQNEELGINDLDSGPGIPTAMNSNSLLSRLGDPGSSVSRDEIAQAQEHLKKMGINI
tara:strand:- start:354 stop:1193 length:840 start_codon:yes stop_codon:yes gene_type:complete